MAKPVFVIYGQKFPLTELDAEEREIFDEQFEILIGTDDSVERMIMKNRKEVLYNFICAVKAKLNDAKFTGIQPADAELGFGPIRPRHMQRAGTALTKWEWSVPTTFGDWLSGRIDEEGAVIILGLRSLRPRAVMTEAKFKVERRELVPVSIRSLMLRDNRNGVQAIPVPTVPHMPEETYKHTARADYADIDEVEPLGWAVGLGRWLLKE